MCSVNLNSFCKGSVFKYSHSGGLGLQNINFEGIHAFGP